MSLPQEEYQTMILVLKDKLRKVTLAIEEEENSLDDKFEAMKDISGWNEEGEEHALVVQKPQFKKIFKGKCGHCGKYGDKAAECYERKTHQEKKNIGGVFQPSEQVKNNMPKLHYPSHYSDLLLVESEILWTAIWSHV